MGNKNHLIIWEIFLYFLIVLFFENCFASKASEIPAGKYIQVGHNSIYTVSFGEGPNVIFESGLGANLENWKYVAPSISKNAHVILYNRAGIGNSSVVTSRKARTLKML